MNREEVVAITNGPQLSAQGQARASVQSKLAAF